jgi:hypothetical protein
MAERAARCGLALELPPPDFKLAPNVQGELRDSMTWIYRLWLPLVRQVRTDGAFPNYEHVDPATYERKRLVSDYRPTNVP